MSAKAASRGAPRSWDSYAEAPPKQWLWVGLGLILFLPGLALTTLRVLPPMADGPALLASFASYAVVPYAGSLLCFLVALVRAHRRRTLAVLSTANALLLACHLGWLAPLFRADDRAPTTDGFTLMSLNVLHGAADTRQVTLKAESADIVVLLEANPTAVRQFDQYGWHQRFPHSAGWLEGQGDTYIFSRYPLSERVEVPGSSGKQRLATARVPALGPVRILAAHPCNPFCGRNLWRAEHAQLSGAVRANLDRPLVVAGDLNATPDHGPLQALRRDGLTSVVDITGDGWQPTYPVHPTLPPFLAIDHVLVNRFLTATSVQRFQVAGTDHLGLLTEIAATSP